MNQNKITEIHLFRQKRQTHLSIGAHEIDSRQVGNGGNPGRDDEHISWRTQWRWSGWICRRFPGGIILQTNTLRPEKDILSCFFAWGHAYNLYLSQLKESVIRDNGKIMEEKNDFCHQSLRPSGPRTCDPAGEFSLLDFWRVIARKWKFILAGISCPLVGAVIYLMMSTPLYETEVILLPPEPRHVSALNVRDLEEITAAGVYGEFVRNLKSNSLRRQFFDQNNLGAVLGKEPFADNMSIFKNLFNNRVKVSIGTNNEDGFVSVSFRGEDLELTRELLNDFVLLVARQTISEITEGIKKQIDMEMELLSEQIRIDRLFARELRLDRIAMLEEQLAIARELNIVSRESTPFRTVAGKNFGVAVTTSEEPLYLRGIRELTAEKEVLEKRKNDDHFIPDFRDKQIKLAQLASSLRKLQESSKEIYAARIDQSASTPESPVQPQMILLLVQSLVLGGVLGIFAAFLSNFIEQRRAGASNKDSKVVFTPVP